MKEIFFGIVLAACVTVGAIYALVALNKASMQNACLVFAQESNRQTKFVSYGYGNYDCLTPSKDNEDEWISAYNIRGE